MCGTCCHAPQDDASLLNDLPPSAHKVAQALERDGPLTQKELVERTDLASRTVRSAVADLIEVGIVNEELYLQDLRQRQYVIAKRPAVNPKH